MKFEYQFPYKTRREYNHDQHKACFKCVLNVFNNINNNNNSNNITIGPLEPCPSPLTCKKLA